MRWWKHFDDDDDDESGCYWLGRPLVSLSDVETLTVDHAR